MCVLALAGAVSVWGRAGGGDGYGTGWNDGDVGGGGGGGGEVFLLRLLLLLVFHHPLIGIPLLIIVCAALVRGGSIIQSRRVASTIVRGVQRQNQDRLGQVFERIRTRDPGFDPIKLQERIHTAFLKAQVAWTHQNLDPLRPFVSDGLFEQWNIQFRAHQKMGLKNIVADMRVTSVDIVGADQTPCFDTVHAKINAAGVDKWISLETGEVVKGKLDPEPFCEYWTFLRRIGAHTLAGAGLMEGQCPNCGAGLSLNDKANCSACGSLVASAEYDWTLIKVTQPDEWRFREHKRDVPGVAAYLAADPGFNVEFLEDRVASVFWRHQQALLEKSPDPMRKVALPAFCDALAFPPVSVGYLDGAVGVTEITSINFGDPYDRVAALVKWAGVPFSPDRPKPIKLEAQQKPVGEPRKIDSSAYQQSPCSSQGIPDLFEKTFYSHLFTLVRRRGCVTDVQKGLLSLHCAGCGAAETASHQSLCAYCGRPLGNGDHDWVLESIVPAALGDFYQRSVNETGIAHTDLLDPMGLLACMVAVSMADGKLDPAERKVLDSFAQRRHIPPERVRAFLKAHDTQTPPKPETVPESSRWLDDLVDLCYADGEFSETERHALIALGKIMGHSAADVNLRVRRKKTDLYKEARAALCAPEPADPFA